MVNLNNVLSGLGQTVISGGIHTHPSARLLLFALAVSIEAKDILELGYDAGTTTEVLAQTGANVIGVDDETEYEDVKIEARRNLAGYLNCKLIKAQAWEYLKGLPADSFDLIFVDDCHFADHVRRECVEIRRVLRSGGVAVFHDTTGYNLWGVIEDVLGDWQRINLVSRSPALGIDCGLGIVRKATLPSVV